MAEMMILENLEVKIPFTAQQWETVLIKINNHQTIVLMLYCKHVTMECYTVWITDVCTSYIPFTVDLYILYTFKAPPLFFLLIHLSMKYNSKFEIKIKIQSKKILKEEFSYWSHMF